MNFESTLDIYLRARCTLMVLVTPEEERALQTVQAVCERTQRPCLTWDMAEGFRALIGGGNAVPSARDPLAALEQVDKAEDNALFVFKDFHECWSNAQVKRKLRSVVQRLKFTRKSICVTSPSSKVPEELQDEAVIVAFPPPGAVELEAVLQRLTQTPGVRVLSALQTQQRALLTTLGPEVVVPLLAACGDDDSTIASQARLTVAELVRPETQEVLADTLCAQWAETRELWCADLMLQGHYVAQQPLAIRVLSALKTAQPHLLTGLGADVVEPLLQACEDNDVAIREPARLALQHLEQVEAREALCHFLIGQDHAIARAAALQARYAPRDEYQRALFFFLTEQWERYDALDFNRYLLTSIYASADQLLRQRLTDKLRVAGRTDFVTILVGRDPHKGDYDHRVIVQRGAPDHQSLLRRTDTVGHCRV